MDHPGYEIIREDEDFFVGKSLGGVPRAAAMKGVDCFSFDQENNRHPCRIEPWNDGGEGEVKVVSEIKLDVGTPITFNLPDFSLIDNQIEMRALDDLAGCASIMASLIELNRESVVTDIFGIFTRAEEVGLVGAGLIAAEQTIPSNTFVVSVETSSVIPGVEQGMGPVIRTGDASYTFDAEAENILALAKKSLLAQDPEFKCQRQLMAAGSCEATAFAVNGYSTTGIAFPLGNWHNATTKIPDPEGSVGMEYISQSDFLNGIDLIFTSALVGYSNSSSPIKERLFEVQGKLKDRLRRPI
jgi:endoglucanase